MYYKHLFFLLAWLFGFGTLQAQSSASAQRWAVAKYTRAIIEQEAPEGENVFAGRQAEQTFRLQCKKLSTVQIGEDKKHSKNCKIN